MNRAIKRSMQRKQVEKQTVPMVMDNSKFMQHVAKKQAQNEGIVIGFVACMELIREAAVDVHGIGEKRLEGLLRSLGEKLGEYKEKLNV